MKKKILAAALACLLALPAMAQPKAPGTDYPNKPVRVIVAFAAGGNADINARLISTALSQQLGQQFVVENRPSGGGTVAFETIAQTPADGYTLLVGALGSHTLNVGLYGERLRIHPLTGVDHITITSHSPIVLATHPSMNVRTLAEFRAAVAASGGLCEIHGACFFMDLPAMVPPGIFRLPCCCICWACLPPMYLIAVRPQRFRI